MSAVVDMVVRASMETLPKVMSARETAVQGREQELVESLHLLSFGNMDYVFGFVPRADCSEMYNATLELFRTRRPKCWEDVMSYLTGRFPGMTRNRRSSMAMVTTMLYREQENVDLLDDGVVELLEEAEAEALELIGVCDTEALVRVAPRLAMTVFEMVIATRSDKLLRAAIESAPEEMRRRLRTRPLVAVAVGMRNVGAVDALVEMGCDVDAMHGGVTAMQVAAEKRMARAIPVLAGHGAMVDARSLEVAARKRDDVLRTMVAFVRDVNASLMGGRTPLMACIAARDVEAARLLLGRGAAVGAATEDGTTALHMAVEHGMCVVVRQLLDMGADPHARRGGDASTPLHLAVSRCRKCTRALKPVTCVRAMNRMWQTPAMLEMLVGRGGRGA